MSAHTVKTAPCKTRRCRTNWLRYYLLHEDDVERLYDVQLGPRTAEFVSLKPTDRGPFFGYCDECRGDVEAIGEAVAGMVQR